MLDLIPTTFNQRRSSFANLTLTIYLRKKAHQIEFKWNMAIVKRGFRVKQLSCTMMHPWYTIQPSAAHANTAISSIAKSSLLLRATPPPSALYGTAQSCHCFCHHCYSLWWIPDAWFYGFNIWKFTDSLSLHRATSLSVILWSDTGIY